VSDCWLTQSYFQLHVYQVTTWWDDDSKENECR